MKNKKLLNEIFGMHIFREADVPGSPPPTGAASTGEANSGLRITGDEATFGVLGQALELLSKHGADDDAEWADGALEAMQGSKNGSVTLPAYKATPGLDSFNDDTGSGPEEEGY